MFREKKKEEYLIKLVVRTVHRRWSCYNFYKYKKRRTKNHFSQLTFESSTIALSLSKPVEALFLTLIFTFHSFASNMFHADNIFRNIHIHSSLSFFISIGVESSKLSKNINQFISALGEKPVDAINEITIWKMKKNINNKLKCCAFSFCLTVRHNGNVHPFVRTDTFKSGLQYQDILLCVIFALRCRHNLF